MDAKPHQQDSQQQARGALERILEQMTRPAFNGSGTVKIGSHNGRIDHVVSTIEQKHK